MKRLEKLIILLVFSFQVFGCSSRALLRDDAGLEISKSEVKARQKHNNLALFALGGGALSFGTSFFIGSLVDRSSEGDSRTALWVITGAGTAVGLALFAQAGNTRDFNVALESIKDERNKSAADKLTMEREKRNRIENEKKKLLEERKKQEAERKKLLEELEKRKKQNNQ